MAPTQAGQRTSELALDAFFILILAALLGVTANLVRPTPLPWAENWSHRVESQASALGIRVASAEQAKQLMDEAALYMFDARSAEHFAEGHLPMALSLPSASFDESFAQYAQLMIPEQEALVYCSGLACDESLLVCKSMLKMGFTNLVLFAGGIEKWEEEGYALEASY